MVKALTQTLSWCRRNLYSILVWILCVPAFLVPMYLLKNGHNPPVGVYIAIMGGAAAYVTFRENLRPTEKAAWIFLITLLIVAEIRNLYVADAEQVSKFAKISEALDETSRGLDATAKGIEGTAKALDKSITDSEQRFSATMERTDAVLTSITGGKSYGAVVPMLGNLLPGQDIPLAVENHGTHILTGVSVTLYDTGVWILGTRNNILQAVKNRRMIGTLHPEERLVLDVQIHPEQFMALDNAQTKFRVFAKIAAQNFTCDEYLDFRREPTGLWVYRYKIYRQNTSADIVRAVKNKRVAKEKFLEAVDWSTDSNAPVRIKSDIPDWN